MAIHIPPVDLHALGIRRRGADIPEEIDPNEAMHRQRADRLMDALRLEDERCRVFKIQMVALAGLLIVGTVLQLLIMHYCYGYF